MEQKPLIERKKPVVMKVDMGRLFFIGEKSGAHILYGYDAKKDDFSRVIRILKPSDKLSFFTSTCAGVVARNLNPQTGKFLKAIAHVPGASLDSYFGVPEHQLRNVIKQTFSDEEIISAIDSPHFFADAVVRELIKQMGSNIEVNLSGGMPSNNDLLSSKVILSLWDELESSGVPRDKIHVSRPKKTTFTYQPLKGKALRVDIESGKKEFSPMSEDAKKLLLKSIKLKF